MNNKEIRVFAPATVSNIACGFDIMGFALDYPGDEIELKIVDSPGVKIISITGDSGKIPTDYKLNTCGFAVHKMLAALNLNFGVEISIIKKMPLGSGLGSSAASAVGGVFALNKLLGEPLCNSELIKYALFGEEIASNAFHADNVAPSLYGGFVIIRGSEPFDIIPIETPDDLFCTVIYPHVQIKTSEARKILPELIPLKDAVLQWGNVAGLITGLLTKDYSLISRSLSDEVIEKHRSKLIIGYKELKYASLSAGALGCNISGSGPSIFTLCKGMDSANKVKESFRNTANKLNISHTIYLSKINSEGYKVI